MSRGKRVRAWEGTVLFASLATGVGGAERSLALLVQELPALGWRPLLAAPQGAARRMLADVGAPGTCELRPVPAISDPSDGPRRYRVAATARAAAASLVNAQAIARSARRHGAQLIVSNSFHVHPSVAIGARLAGVPWVLYLRDLVRSGLGQRVLGSLGRGAGASIAISHAVEASVPGLDMHVIENPVRPSRTAPDSSWAEPIVGYLGRLDPEKGVEDLIASAPRLPGVIELHGAPVVSGATYGARLRRMVAALPSDKVRICGWSDDPERTLSRFSVLVVPSRREPWGRVAAEGMAVGVPVVAASTGGLPELVRDGVSGLLFPPGDVDALVAAVGRVSREECLRERLVAGGLDRVSTLTPTRHAERVSRLFSVVAE